MKPPENKEVLQPLSHFVSKDKFKENISYMEEEGFYPFYDKNFNSYYGSIDCVVNNNPKYQRCSGTGYYIIDKNNNFVKKELDIFIPSSELEYKHTKMNKKTNLARALVDCVKSCSEILKEDPLAKFFIVVSDVFIFKYARGRFYNPSDKDFFKYILQYFGHLSEINQHRMVFQLAWNYYSKNRVMKRIIMKELVALGILPPMKKPIETVLDI